MAEGCFLRDYIMILNRIVMVATFSMLCLGTVISNSNVIAMENNESPEGRKEQAKGHEGFVSLYYLDEESYEKALALFERELKDEKSHDYASGYAMFKTLERLDDEKARRFAEIYEREISNDENYYYAYEYAKLKMLVEFDELEQFDEEMLDECSIIFRDEIEKGKSGLYAHEYALLTHYNFKEESEIRLATEICIQEILAGRSNDYAMEYACLLIKYRIEEATARKQAEIFEKNICNGRAYARKYAELIAIYNLNEDIAKKITDGYIYNRKNEGLSAEIERNDEKLCIYKRKIKKGEEHIYAIEYARLLIDEGITEEKANTRAKIYESEINNGQTSLYAREYARLIVEDELEGSKAQGLAKEIELKAEEKDTYFEEDYARLDLKYDKKSRSNIFLPNDYITQDFYKDECKNLLKIYEDKCLVNLLATIFDRDIKLGKSYAYAREHAKAKIIYNLDENTAKRQAKICEMEVKRGESYVYASEYARLIVICKENIINARKMAAIFDQEMKFFRRECFSRKYAELITKSYKGYEGNVRATSEVLEYEEQINQGKSEIYASEYARVSFYYNVLHYNGGNGLDMEKLHEMASLFEQKILEGKSELYAREYARLKVICKETDEKAQKKSEIFTECIEKGMKPEAASEYVISIMEKGEAKEPPFKKIKL